jgi:uncharacterized SAM-binding protein YcdF (DUF218 family)
MTFYASKVLGFLTQPSTLMWVLLVVGLVRARRPASQRSGLRMAAAAAALMALCGLTPVSTWFKAPLEERFPRIEVTAGSGAYAGIIVLGGGEDGRASVLRHQLHINESGERITEGAVLAFRLPQARLIFTGGAAAVLNDNTPGAQSVGAFWREIGIAGERITLEDRSRNTYENAIYTYEILKPKAGERFLLVTSAAHMPRAMGVFRKAGFDVVAYPADYHTNFPADAIDTFGSIPAGLKRFDESMKEWVGLVAYWLMGRTSALFPGPD